MHVIMLPEHSYPRPGFMPLIGSCSKEFKVGFRSRSRSRSLKAPFASSLPLSPHISHLPGRPNSMPMATATSAELEVLTFLSDPNAQVRQVALSNIVGFSAKGSSHRSLLTDKHKGNDGKPLKGRDGKDVDTIEDLKKLCKDQPVSSCVLAVVLVCTPGGSS